MTTSAETKQQKYSRGADGRLRTREHAKVKPDAAPAFDTSRNVSEAEIRQWAATRADDAGYLARQLIALKDQKGGHHDKA